MARRDVDRTARSLALATLLAWVATPAAAFEFLDGRLKVHGYFETQIRGLVRDFDASDDIDLAQWWNVLDVEVEADVAPDGFGPFDLVTAFARIEIRYDCVWTRGCGMFSSADTYGDRAKRLPQRLADGRRSGYSVTGNLRTNEVRRFVDIPREFLPFEFRNRPAGSRKPSPFFDIERIDTLFDNTGVNGVFGDADDPAPFYFDRVLRNDCVFGFRKIRGPEDGIGHQNLGPWKPHCKIVPVGTLVDRPNPFRAGDVNPITGAGGSAALPLRPAPERAFTPSLLANRYLEEARGVYYPNEALAERLRKGSFGDFDQNFRQEELAWNHGASQQDEKELKELYFDIEMLDSRLWLRLGKQTIVWGKTELFRNQDQWNPVDLALASLPDLEEARIAQWALRGVFSFFTVGPLEDVRLEMAALFDQFEPTDLGRCGEPYSPLPVCDKTFGLFIHGLAAIGVAGEVRPPDPWDSSHGLEYGARLEFRWERFSFALSDYYGFTDTPYQDQLFVYSRNVDPSTGRPRRGMATGSCETGSEDACLTEKNALAHHSANQQIFAMICATSIGFSTLDQTACGQSVFNSQNQANVLFTVSQAVGVLLAGDPTNPVQGSPGAVLNALTDPDDAGPLPGISFDPLVHLTINNPPAGPAPSQIFGLDRRLTDMQEALLGCGPFYGTNCDDHGIDLLNTEFSALGQSWPGFEGAGGFDWDTTDPDTDQPGTTGFRGGPVCTRFENGRTYILPGCRGPGDPGYDPTVDGVVPNGAFTFPAASAAARFTGNQGHPFTGQTWRSEMSALSFNTLMALVALAAPDPEGPTGTQFDLSDPFRNDGCSFAKPHLCDTVQAFYQITGLQRNNVRAAGDGRFGRRDFVWHGGAPVVLRYDKRNVLGFSTDFAEDVTKSNWGAEFSWVDGTPYMDRDEPDGVRDVDTYNLTISVDRPTFINFLNPNRTFFFNTQWFIQYVDGYRKNFPTNGPWSVLATFTIDTGFYRDRLRPTMTLVYDFQSNSGAFLPRLTYRYTENLSVTFGMAFFMGRMEPRAMALNPSSLGNRTGRDAYLDFVENGLSAVRERDELYMRVRYTF